MLWHFIVTSGRGQTDIELVAYLSNEDNPSVPAFISDDEGDGFLCVKATPASDSSQFNHDPLDWMKFVIRKVAPKKSNVIDIFGSGMWYLYCQLFRTM